jgi:putative MATE family efflux protein
LGHKDKQDSDAAGRQVLLSSFALSVLVMLFCLCCYKWLLKIIFGHVEQDVMDSAITYFYITIFSYPFLALFGASAALYRAGGNSRLPMIISVSSNVLNIIGNALLIFVFHLGVAGAAISTLVSQAAAAVAILICQTRPGQTIEVGNLIKIRPNFHMIWLVLCIGIPTGIENAMFQFGKLVVQSTVSTLGTTAIASNAVVVVLELLTSTPSMAIGLGLMTVVGQCVGAGKLDEARYYTKKLTIWSFVVLFVVNWLIYFITPAVTSIAGMEADAAAMTVRVMLIISIVKPFTWPLAFTPCNGTRAAGDVKFTMIVSTITMWILRVGLATVLCRCLGVGLEGIWCGYFADWTMRSVLFTIRFHGEKWHQHHIIKDI